MKTETIPFQKTALPNPKKGMKLSNRLIIKHFKEIDNGYSWEIVAFKLSKNKLVRLVQKVFS